MQLEMEDDDVIDASAEDGSSVVEDATRAAPPPLVEVVDLTQ
jgi:hypothetical protein